MIGDNMKSILARTRIFNRTGVKMGIFLLFIICGFVLSQMFVMDLDDFKETLNSYPKIFAGIVFVVIYVVSTMAILFGPKDVLRIAGAIIFGPYVSSAFVWVGEMCNLLILFGVSRKLGREYVQKKFKLNDGIIGKSKKRGMTVCGIFTLRINPLIPFRLMDLSFGLTSVDLKRYFLVCLFASVPRIFLVQYIIHGVGHNIFGDLSSVIVYLQRAPDVIMYAGFYMLVVIVCSVGMLILRNFKK